LFFDVKDIWLHLSLNCEVRGTIITKIVIGLKRENRHTEGKFSSLFEVCEILDL
jgi:hypothetical protein